MIRPLASAALIAAQLYLISLASADVSIRQNVSIEASGTMAMLSSSGTVETMISGERGRTENRMESKSAMMKTLAKNANTATVVLLDQDKMLNLMPDEKKYSEMTFTEMRQRLEQASAQLEQAQGAGLPVSEDECQWTEPVMQVQKTRNKEKFAGVKARQTLISASQTCVVPSSGKTCEMTWILDYWNAEKMPGGDEALAFQQGMARALGGEEALSMAQVQARGLVGMFKHGWDEVLQESGDIKGFPVKTVMTLEMGGENCTVASGQPIAMDDVWSSAGDAAIGAAGNSAASHAGYAAGRETSEALGHGVGGSIAGSAVGAASRELVSGMFGKFKKNKKQKESEAQAAAPGAGKVTLFRISTELTDIHDEDIPDSQFRAPEGWTRVKPAF